MTRFVDGNLCRNPALGAWLAVALEVPSNLELQDVPPAVLLPPFSHEPRSPKFVLPKMRGTHETQCEWLVPIRRTQSGATAVPSSKGGSSLSRFWSKVEPGA